MYPAGLGLQLQVSLGATYVAWARALKIRKAGTILQPVSVNVSPRKALLVMGKHEEMAEQSEANDNLASGSAAQSLCITAGRQRLQA